MTQLQIGTQHELEHTSSRKVAKRIAQDHLREDPKYYAHLTKMERKVKSGEWNPSVSKKQQRFMCAEYGRKKRGKKTRTGMNKRQLREFCVRRKKNPHLTGKWRFVGYFEKNEIGKVRRLLKIQGIKVKITKDMRTGDKNLRELYVSHAEFHTATMIINRVYYAQKGR